MVPVHSVASCADVLAVVGAQAVADRAEQSQVAFADGLLAAMPRSVARRRPQLPGAGKRVAAAPHATAPRQTPDT